ncbi:hypothetical protein GCM10011403_25890 [Pseudohongiella nitratireducens]|uniref:Glycine zipper 2TM domain-containing protein n=1 Tax=Pseudohongiella nitratireducens TaxID=1768907 RepID=A0A916QL16_9GAMM|nr:glycine zipper 2TM domain-containing protein [Pseudohongiella nitratireducens]MDF1623368.1 glycine zipper 2TM domain-containing protein [Pseudohongiella nitratireducens]GFZ81436.1 hypothetical protein GCM10011403_25890 [Pseudohongiella nitratireducens]
MVKTFKMVAAATVAGLVATSVHAESQYVYADVVDVRPIYQAVTVSVPQETCWQEQVAIKSSRRESKTPVLVSTIVGGAIGNALGSNKSSQRVGAVVGAVLGHSVGRDIVASNRRHEPARYEMVEHCEVSEVYRDEERMVGYQVKYEYAGEIYAIQTENDPGDQIRLRIDITPTVY